MKLAEKKRIKQALRDKTQLMLGELLIKLRDRADLSQEDLAYESGISRSFMSKIETGKTTLSVLTLMQLAKGLGRKPSEILAELEKQLEENNITIPMDSDL